MLRHIREAAGLPREELAARASLSVSTIVSYESGWRSPVRQTVAEQIEPALGSASNGVLLKLWDELEEAMNYSVSPDGWWISLTKNVRQTRFAATAWIWCLACYRLRITRDEIEVRVAERMKRQEILVKESPPLVLAIVDGAALHRPIGGYHVMAEQVRRLIDAGGEPSIRITVLPLATGAHEGLSGEFELLDFTGKRSAGYQEGAVRGMSLPEPEDVEGLRVKWDTLNGEAASASASKVMLEEAYKRWTRAT
jgi:DNA-binding XRE family transcriptional regulator